MSNHEILFRGKDGYNGEWVEGYYYRAKWCRADKELCDFITMPYPNEENRPSDHFMVIQETIGQSTAMKDNNGNRIFEDDILRFMLYGHSYTGVVTYKKGAFVVVCTQPLQYSFCMAATVSLEEAIRYGAVVIGNVHDNTELLEDAKT